MHITEPSSDDYDNDGSDNCDYNFVTFDDFGVKNDKKKYMKYVCMQTNDTDEAIERVVTCARLLLSGETTWCFSE